MKRIILCLATGSLLFAASAPNVTLNRKVDLLVQAVSDLIDKNQNLQNQIDKLKEITKINSQMIASNRHLIENLDKNGFNELAIVTAYKLNVRSKPSLKSKVIRKLRKGDVVKVYDTVVNGKDVWYKIIDGYISAYYTNLVIRRKR